MDLRNLPNTYLFSWAGRPYRKIGRVASTIPEQILDAFIVQDLITEELHMMNGSNYLEKWHSPTADGEHS